MFVLENQYDTNQLFAQVAGDTRYRITRALTLTLSLTLLLLPLLPPSPLLPSH